MGLSWEKTCKICGYANTCQLQHLISLRESCPIVTGEAKVENSPDYTGEEIIGE